MWYDVSLNCLCIWTPLLLAPNSVSTCREGWDTIFDSIGVWYVSGYVDLML